MWSQDGKNALPEAPSATQAQAAAQTPAEAPQPTGTTPAASLDATYTPLTPGQKFEHFGKRAVSPYFVLGAGLGAGISQAEDKNHGYGQGAEGYGKRFGASMADQASSNFFGAFLYPTLFHQDPRYFRKGEGTKGQRIGYAVSRVFVTRTDSGGSAFNISRVLGSLSSAALSNVYYSASEQTGAKTLEHFGISLGSSAGFNILREFWPRHRNQ